MLHDCPRRAESLAPETECLLYARYWFRSILSELIGAATESAYATVNGPRESCGHQPTPFPTPTGLTPEKWKQTATLCPLDWPSNQSLLRLWHTTKSFHQCRTTQAANAASSYVFPLGNQSHWGDPMAQLVWRWSCQR